MKYNLWGGLRPFVVSFLRNMSILNARSPLLTVICSVIYHTVDYNHDSSLYFVLTTFLIPLSLPHIDFYLIIPSRRNYSTIYLSLDSSPFPSLSMSMIFLLMSVVFIVQVYRIPPSYAPYKVIFNSVTFYILIKQRKSLKWNKTIIITKKLETKRFRMG